jgi:EmrB/QacA subfamily drug resistance transporter
MERTEANVQYGSPTGRWVLLAAVLGSAVVMIDATVVNLALAAMGADLHIGFAGLQWLISAYLVTLSALILLGGALGDLYGRRRVFVAGTAWFAAASLLCAIAPSATLLIAARALQGVGGALLTPSSLAIIQSSFHPDDRGRAIGAWSGLGGIAAAVGPFVGGWLVGFSWRAIFFMNLPLAAAVIVVALRHVPESSDPSRRGWHPDVAGGLFGAIGLAALTFALIEGPTRGWTTRLIFVAAGLALAGFVGFAITEVREGHPMLPLRIFRSMRFTGTNIATFVIYGALGGFFFLFAVNLQRALEYSPLEAGAASLPVTVLLLALSARAGRLAQRIGPRLPMTAGPVVMAVGLLIARSIQPGESYASAVLPAVVVFALGLVLTVAPLTATALSSADPELAGVASGVNNAVARAGGLVAVALLPAVAGLGGSSTPGKAALAAGFRTAMTLAAAATAAGGLIALLTVGKERPPAPAIHEELHCAVAGPPMRPAEPRWGCPQTAS